MKFKNKYLTVMSKDNSWIYTMNLKMATFVWQILIIFEYVVTFILHQALYLKRNPEV